MKRDWIIGLAAIVAALGSAEAADVFNMPTGLTSLETVPVGNPGNAGEQSRLAVHGDETYYGGVDYDCRIGKYEVTVGQYCEFLNKTAGVDAYGLYNTSMWSHDYGCKIERYDGNGTGGDPYQYRVDADWANRPVNFVSWGDAARFANWLHNGQPNDNPSTTDDDASTTEDGSYYLNGATSNAELLAVSRKVDDWKWAITSEDEWYKAAYHKNDGITGNYWDYPTGSDTAPTSEVPTGTDMTNGSANYWDGDYLDTTYYTTEVGAYTGKPSDSACGTFDQGGNVWEWNEAIIDGLYRGLRGGAFEFGGYVDGYDLSVNVRSYNEPMIESYNIGFRVSQVPEPAALTLLTLGGLAMLRRRRE